MKPSRPTTLPWALPSTTEHSTRSPLEAPVVQAREPTWMTRWRRIASGLLALVLVVAGWTIRETSYAEAEAGLRRSLVSFALARGLSAAVAVAAGTQVHFSPAGIGITLSPGQALKPVSDVLEQFSHLMLAASVAFGIQMALIQIGAHWLVPTALTVALLTWLIWQVRGWRQPPWLLRGIVLLVISRFAMPFAIGGSELVYQHFLASRYQGAQQQLQTHGEAVQQETVLASQAAGKSADSERSMLEKAKEGLKALDVRHIPERLKARGEAIMNQLVQLAVIFTLQTIVLPLGFLWLLATLSRGVLQPRI